VKFQANKTTRGSRAVTASDQKNQVCRKCWCPPTARALPLRAIGIRHSRSGSSSRR